MFCRRPLRSVSRFASVLLALALLTPLAFAAGRVNYEEFLAMDDARKQEAAEEHVRKRGPYYVLSYGNYIIHTDRDPVYALKMTVLMDDFFRRFSTVFRGEFKRDDQPRVFIMADRAGYQDALNEVGRTGAGWSAGMYMPGKRALFADGSYGEDALIEILFHEGTHQLNHAFMNTQLPVWFDEGLATNFESWDLTRDHKNNVANAIYASRRIDTLAQIYPDRGFVPFSQMVNLSHMEWSMTSNPTPNYASAWITTYFLITCDDGRKLMNALVRNFRKGGSQKRVLSRALIMRVEEKLNNFIETRILPSVKYGRDIMQSIKQRDFATAYTRAKAMAKEYPDNPEAKLFTSWLSVTQDKLEGEALNAAIRTLEALDDDDDFDHPELEFALAQAHAKAGNFEVALRHAENAVEGNRKHPFAPKLLEKLSGVLASH